MKILNNNKYKQNLALNSRTLFLNLLGSQLFLKACDNNYNPLFTCYNVLCTFYFFTNGINIPNHTM